MITTLTKVPTRTTRTVSAIAATGIMFVVVALIPEVADQFHEMQKLHDPNESIAGLLPVVDSRIDAQFHEASAQLEHLEAMMIGPDQLPSIQNDLLVLARECDCQIRKVAIQSGYSENWDSTRDRDTKQAEQVEIDHTADYNLQSEHILLSLSGSFEQITKFVQSVRAKPWLLKFSQFNISRQPDEKGRLSMEATIAFFRLTKNKKEEFIDWRSEPGKSPIQ